MEKTKDQKTDKVDNKDQEIQDTKEETETKQETNLNQSKTSKPKKIVYLNQKVILPATLPDRIEYIRELFYNEEVGFTVNYAPFY